MENWKTTLGGIVCILCGVALIVVLMVNQGAQSVTAVVIPVIVSLIGGGLALLGAKDAKKYDE